MAFRPFNTRRDNAQDDAWFAGVRPGDFNQLGPYPEGPSDPKGLNSKFVSQKDNPDPRALASSRFDDPTANRSREKMATMKGTDYPFFTRRDGSYDEPTNETAIKFLRMYSESPFVDKKISSQSIIASEEATAGSNERSPNTAGKFPSQGVNV